MKHKNKKRFKPQTSYFMNKVSVISLDKKFKKFEKKIKIAALKILKILNKNNILVGIYLVGSQKIRFLNKKFRGKDKSTNVLSFKEPNNFPHPEFERRTMRTKRGQTQKLTPLGEIYLNAELYGRDAERRGKFQRKSALSPRLSALLVHGLLHLLGYNHKKKRDRIKMEKMEQRLLKFLMPNS